MFFVITHASSAPAGAPDQPNLKALSLVKWADRIMTIVTVCLMTAAIVLTFIVQSQPELAENLNLAEVAKNLYIIAMIFLAIDSGLAFLHLEKKYSNNQIANEPIERAEECPIKKWKSRLELLHLMMGIISFILMLVVIYSADLGADASVTAPLLIIATLLPVFGFAGTEYFCYKYSSTWIDYLDPRAESVQKVSALEMEKIKKITEEKLHENWLPECSQNQRILYYECPNPDTKKQRFQLEELLTGRKPFSQKVFETMFDEIYKANENNAREKYGSDSMVLDSLEDKRETAEILPRHRDRLRNDSTMSNASNISRGSCPPQRQPSTLALVPGSNIVLEDKASSPPASALSPLPRDAADGGTSQQTSTI